MNLSSVPLSITYPNGDMRKTAKSNLLKELEMESGSVTHISKDINNKTCYIIDLMGIVQLVKKGDCKNFGDLCLKLTNFINCYFEYTDLLVITPDCYDILDSIKSFERMRRAQNNIVRDRVITNNLTPLPANLKEYLSNPHNKTEFVNFLLNFMMENFQNSMSQSQELLIGLLDGTAWKIKQFSQIQVNEIFSNHEEADSRMFVYAS